MRIKTTIFFLFALLAFSSCKTYEVKHFKDGSVDKVDLKKYKVYLHDKKNIYLVAKPAISPAGITGDITRVKDNAEADEIRNPSTPGLIKKHRHDLVLLTKTEVADSTVTISLKKGDIVEYNLTISHSKVNWDKIGEAIGGVLGVAVCIALMSALVYWFTLA
jgi:hypothetical protein